MDSGHDILSRHPVAHRRLTRAEYYRLGEVGILRSCDRVELLEGRLVEMSPIGPRHAFAVNLLARLLGDAVGRDVYVSVQNPIVLDDGSEPQPDIVLAGNMPSGYRSNHPTASDVLLLIEAADSSRDFDLGAKRELYARAGIREFWVVDLIDNEVVVHRNPTDGDYLSIEHADATETLEIDALPGVVVSVSSIIR
jgi:Uma2 family endonuclease